MQSVGSTGRKNADGASINQKSLLRVRVKEAEEARGASRVGCVHRLAREFPECCGNLQGALHLVAFEPNRSWYQQISGAGLARAAT